MIAAGEYGITDRLAFHASALALSLYERVTEVPGEMAQGMATVASHIVEEVNAFDRRNTEYLGLVYQSSLSRPFVNIGAVAWHTGKSLVVNAATSVGEGLAMMVAGRNADEIGMGATRFITGGCSAVSLAVAPLLPTSAVNMTYPTITMGSDGSLAVATASMSVPVPSAGVGIAVAQGMGGPMQKTEPMQMSSSETRVGRKAVRQATAHLGNSKTLAFIHGVALEIEEQITSLTTQLRLAHNDVVRASLQVERAQLISLRNSLENLCAAAVRGESVGGRIQTIFTSPTFNRLNRPGTSMADIDEILTKAYELELRPRGTSRPVVDAM